MVKNHSTSLRRLFRDLKRLGDSKRPRGSPRPAFPGRQLLPKRSASARVALQNSDSETDAIVITVLESAPFCCHEDLVMMSRPQLVAVALKLNAKLPRALHIDVNPSRPDGYIRNSIELLVDLK